MAVTSPKTQVVRPVVRRDEAAFEDQFHEHYARVFGVLFRLVGDPAQAEDLTLETFWQLWRNPPPNQQTGVGGWLYRVATHLGYNALRAAKRRTHYEDKAGRYDVIETEPPTDPAHIVADAHERAQVRSILSQLPARDAQLLILKHSGLSYKELAAALNLAPTSVGTLLARAEKEFERRWRDVNGDE